MFTDIVGYTSLMQQDETLALKTIERHRSTIEKYTRKYHGEILHYYGDGSLSIFPSAFEAVESALEIQKELTQEPKIPLRIGIHLGDVKQQGKAVFGDGINMASRIESMAVAGSIFITDAIYHIIKNQSEIRTVALGDFQLKNVDYPVSVYALTTDYLTVPKRRDLPGRINSFSSTSRWAVSIAVIVVLIVAGLAIGRFLLDEKIRLDILDKSIAVLPFENLSNDSEQDYFSDGITEDIINHLAKIEALKVKSRTTTAQYKNATKTIPVIGHELGVAYILEGSIRKIENTVRIVAQLIDVKNDTHIWTETYDREMIEIFDIQSDIAVEIAKVLEAKLTSEERRHITGGRRQKMRHSEITAYDLLLRARRIWRKWNDEQDLQNALQLVEESIKMDPGFARAYVLKGNILHYGMREFGVPNQVWISEALELANKAISLDSMLSGAYLLKGSILSDHSMDSEEAFRNLRKAHYLEPGNPEVLQSFGNFQMRIGNYEKGAIRIIQSIERQYSIIDPEYFLRWGSIYQMINEFETAEKLYQKAISMAPGWSSPYYRLGMLYRYQGDLETSEATFIKALELSPFDQQTIDAIGWVNLQAGDMDDAAKYWSMYEEIERQYSDETQYLPFRHRLGYVLMLQGDSIAARELMQEQLSLDLERHQNLRGYGVWMNKGYFYDLAVTNAFLGNKMEALAWLDSTSQSGFINSWYLENDPLLNNIRDDIEFKRIKNDFENRQQGQISAFKKVIDESQNLSRELRIITGQKEIL